MLLQLEETDSTNNYLKQLLSKQEIEECSVVIADKLPDEVKEVIVGNLNRAKT